MPEAKLEKRIRNGLSLCLLSTLTSRLKSWTLVEAATNLVYVNLDKMKRNFSLKQSNFEIPFYSFYNYM